MKKLLTTLSTMILLSIVACAQQNQQEMKSSQTGKKILVVYFSATGTTKTIAQKVAKAAKGRLYEIVPAQAYTSTDLNWHNQQSRSSLEMNTPDSRPAIAGEAVNINDYDVIFLGYPIWWDFAPRPVNTFIESHHFDGKRMIPFATSGGSSINNSVATLKKTYPQIDWAEGKLLNSTSAANITQWVEKVLE